MSKDADHNTLEELSKKNDNLTKQIRELTEMNEKLLDLVVKMGENMISMRGEFYKTTAVLVKACDIDLTSVNDE